MLVTLVGQGLTFALVLRLLKVPSDPDDDFRGLAEAQAAALDAAIDRLAELPVTDVLTPERSAHIREGLEERRDRLQAVVDMDPDQPRFSEVDRATVGALRQELLDAQREELVRWRDAGRLSDADLRKLERRLDVEEITGR